MSTASTTMAAARVFLSATASRLAEQIAVASKCGGRTYAAAAAAAVTRQEPASSSAAAAAGAAKKEDVFWMRDPKTGCWKPENHFDDVDAADLRAQLLFSKN